MRTISNPGSNNLRTGMVYSTEHRVQIGAGSPVSRSHICSREQVEWPPRLSDSISHLLNGTIGDPSGLEVILEPISASKTETSINLEVSITAAQATRI